MSLLTCQILVSMEERVPFVQLISVDGQALDVPMRLAEFFGAVHHRHITFVTGN